MFKGHPDKFALVLIIVFVALTVVGFGAQKYREAYDDTWITPYKKKVDKLEAENDSLRNLLYAKEQEIYQRQKEYNRAYIQVLNLLDETQWLIHKINALDSASKENRSAKRKLDSIVDAEIKKIRSARK